MKILSYVSSDADLTTGFVYKWTNLINGRMYIGSHRGTQRTYIGSGKAFRAAVKKYGIENFSREILYVGKNFCAVEVEILRAIDAEHSLNFYNLVNSATEVPRSSLTGQNKTGKNNGMFGKTHSETTKQKQRDAALRYRKSEETKALIGAQTRARGPRSEETKAKIAASNRAYQEAKRRTQGA